MYVFFARRLAESNARFPVLTKAWVLLVALIVWWVMTRLLLSRPRSNSGDLRSNGIYRFAQLTIAVTLLLAVFFIAPALFRTSAIIERAGASLQSRFADGRALIAGEQPPFFALTPDGTRYSDRAGTEPEYGVPFQPVTTSVAENLSRSAGTDSRAPRRIPPGILSRVVFFDPVSGKPRVWYAPGPHGELEAFDGPGRHPAYNVELQPVTPPIVEQLLRQVSGAVESDTASDGTSQHDAYAPPPANARTVPDRLVLAREADGRVDVTTTQALAAALDADGVYLQRLVAAAGSGTAAGDESALVDRAPAGARFLVLVTVSSRTAATSDGGHSATLSVRAHVIRSNVAPPAAIEIVDTATGTTEADATSRARAIVLERLLQQLSQLP